MRCCGVEIASNELVLVTIEKSDSGAVKIIKDASQKLKLHDSSDQNSVRTFARALDAFARDNKIDVFAIRGRQSSGAFSGGGVTFKIEGLVQLIEGCTAEIIHPNRISARIKKVDFELPAVEFKYQREALEAACCGILNVESNDIEP